MKNLLKSCYGKTSKNGYASLNDNISQLDTDDSYCKAEEKSDISGLTNDGYSENNDKFGYIDSTELDPKIMVNSYGKMIKRLDRMIKEGSSHNKNAVKEAKGTLIAKQQQWQSKLANEQQVPKIVRYK